MAWETNDTNFISKSEAIQKIMEMAKSQNIVTFKVYYNDEIIASPDYLPDMVDMSKVTISQYNDPGIA